MKIRETDFYARIKLEEMGQVKLMNRTDTKYWFNQNQLGSLLGAVQNEYYILTMNNEVALPYRTVYYDTDENQMFIAHHNGKLNRYKVRRRTYVSSGISFLEVKFKNNKGRTIKKRVPSHLNPQSFTYKEQQFLNDMIPFSVERLHTSLINNFSRITLVNKNFKERCTIDFKLKFASDNKNIALNSLVIVEIKADSSASTSPLARTLRNQRIKTSGFSKYCIGRTVTDPSLKRNSFKMKIRNIEKVIQSETSLFI